MSVFRSKYPIGHTVFLKLRKDEVPGMVTCVSFNDAGLVYTVSWGDGSGESQHFPVELTDEFTQTYE